MSSRLSTDSIKAEAQRLGFFRCGVARAAKVSDAYANLFLGRLRRREFADMHYMYENVDKRLDPRLLMPDVKSIICVAMSYAPPRQMPQEEYQIAAYAMGKDYHDVMKKRLFQLAEYIKEVAGDVHYRCFVDTAPVLERYWAQQAGIGWIGKSQLLIIPNAGNMFFLGELFIDLELSYDEPMASRCGRCRRCLDACPTHALHENGLRAEACLSYQTIENRGEISAEAASKLGNRIYGCDECTRACPWNRFAKPTEVDELQPNAKLLAMKKADWQSLTEDEYRTLFKGSAVKRAKYAGLMRNIQAAKKGLGGIGEGTDAKP